MTFRADADGGAYPHPKHVFLAGLSPDQWVFWKRRPQSAACAGLMTGPDGYDLSRALWHDAGWAEVGNLRRRLENLTELRDLVRQLGRASGRGPKRRAPQEVRPPFCSGQV